jgi:hypothetical protein
MMCTETAAEAGEGTTCVSLPVLLATVHTVSSPRGPDHTPAPGSASIHLAAGLLDLNVRDRLLPCNCWNSTLK